MKINELASVPKLLQIDLDSPEIIEQYGESVIFWTYDIVSLSTYFDFFNARSNSEFQNLHKMMRKLILLEDGTEALKDNEDLPIDIAAAAINKIGEILGKSQSRTSTPTVGTPVE
jgi:hypothetical protein